MLGQSFYASRSTSVSSPCLFSLKQSQGAMSKKSEEKILFIFYGKGKIHMPLKNMTSSLSILAACEEVHNNNVLLLLMRKFLNFVKKYISKLYMYTYICRLTFVTNAF